MKQGLLPCPFCGASPTLVSADPARLACVMCKTCDAWYGGCMKDKEAVAGWNTRAPDARVQLLAKALRVTSDKSARLADRVAKHSTEMDLLVVSLRGLAEDCDTALRLAGLYKQ